MTPEPMNWPSAVVIVAVCALYALVIRPFLREDR